MKKNIREIEKKSFYLLGLLLAKGKIQVNNLKNYVDLIFEIRFNKPNTSSFTGSGMCSKLTSLLGDFTEV
jgi:hypothetical protein